MSAYEIIMVGLGIAMLVVACVSLAIRLYNKK